MLAFRPCLVTLAIVYPPFLAAGVIFFRYIVRKRPHLDPRRNKTLTALRFFMHVVLLPVGAVLALAALGWLDPLYFMVRRAGWG